MESTPASQEIKCNGNYQARKGKRRPNGGRAGLHSFTRASTWKDQPRERKGEGKLETEEKESWVERTVHGV